jgi:hypothetical protein
MMAPDQRRAGLVDKKRIVDIRFVAAGETEWVFPGNREDG